MTAITRRGVLAGPALLALPAARAQDGDDRPPEPGPAPQPAWPPVVAFTLANGLEVVVAERPKLPLVTAMVVLRAGRETDSEGAAGRAALAATLLSRGARRHGRARSALQIAQDAEALGGTLDVETQWRHCSLSTTVTSPRLPDALALLADCVRAPLFAPKELDLARTQALDALQVSLSSPAEVATMAARRAIWGATPPGRVTTAQTLSRPAAADLRALHAAAMRPGRAILVLAGAVTAAQARALAEDHFGPWAAGAGDALALPRPLPAPADAPALLVDLPGSGQSAVAMAAPFVAGDAADRAVADLAGAVLGGGYSSRLNQEVRIKRGLSYGVAGFGEPQAAAGAWFAVAQVQHANAGPALQILRGELLRLGRDAPTAAELEARRATVTGALLRRLQTTAGLAQQLAALRVQGRPADALAAYVDALRAVTPEQVRAFAEKTWTESALRAAVAGDLGKAGSALAEAVPRAERRSVKDL